MLAALAITGMITRAAEAAGIARCTHYAWLKSDPVYAEGVEEAMEQAVDVLEAEAARRAVEGVEEPIVVGGKVVKGDDGKPLYRRKYSDVLLIFLLKGARPDKYADRRQIKQNTHVSAEPLATELAKLSPEELRDRVRHLVENVERVGGSGLAAEESSA